jgi:hypothetical protein
LGVNRFAFIVTLAAFPVRAGRAKVFIDLRSGLHDVGIPGWHDTGAYLSSCYGEQG